MTQENGPQIRVIPPLVYLVAFLIGYGLEQLWPLTKVSWPWNTATGVILICLSVLMVSPAIVRFRRAATPFDVRKPATALVTDGPYRYSRNPGYLALTLLYLGGALLVESVWVLILLAPTLVVMTHAVIKKEEEHLEAQFGEAYCQYKVKVRRWL